MSVQEIDFELRVQPKEGWVDAIFIGNILGEFLASLKTETNGAFEYALVENGKEGKAPSGMSIRKAFEQIGKPLPKPLFVTVRQAEGVVNEYDVTLQLNKWRYELKGGGNWQVVVHLWKDHKPKSLDSMGFKTEGEADERFNLLCLQYELKEAPPDKEALG